MRGKMARQEALQGWACLEERVATKLLQLTRLLHHFADVPPGHQADWEDGQAECLTEHGCIESEIQDILRETASRIKEFKDSMKTDVEDGRSQKAVEKLRQREEALKQIDEFSQDSARKQLESLTREVEKVKCELAEKSQELTKAFAFSKQTYQELEELKKFRHKEIEREKLHRKWEVGDVLEKVQKEVLTATQQHFARELELQDLCNKERDCHGKSLEEMTILHKAEIKRLKMEHMNNIEECCQNHASLESEWQDKEMNLQKQISTAVQEKTRILQDMFSVQEKLRGTEDLLEATQTALDNETLAKADLEGDLKFAKGENSLAEENLQSAYREASSLSAALAAVKQEALDAKLTYNAAVTAIEKRAYSIQKDLANVTNTCTVNEQEVKHYKHKMEESQFNLATTRKDLQIALMDVQQLQQELRGANAEVECKEEEKRRMKTEFDMQSQQLTAKISRLQLEGVAKSEQAVLKMKELMESRLRQQIQAHEEILQNLQKAFMTQLEEQKKGGKLHLSSLEGHLCRLRCKLDSRKRPHLDS